MFGKYRPASLVTSLDATKTQRRDSTERLKARDQPSLHQTDSRAIDSNILSKTITDNAHRHQDLKKLSRKFSAVTMYKLQIFLTLVMVIYLVEARHIHPRHMVERIEENKSEAISDVDGLPIDVIRNLAPNRFVPINNVLFFKSYEPCEEGLERDLLGICREVWD